MQWNSGTEILKWKSKNRQNKNAKAIPKDGIKESNSSN